MTMSAETEQLFERIMSLLRQAESLLLELKKSLSRTEREERHPEPEVEEPHAPPQKEGTKVQILVGKEKFEPPPVAKEWEFEGLLELLHEILSEADKTLLPSNDMLSLRKALSHSREVKEESQKGEFAYAASVFLVRLLYKCFGDAFSSLRKKGEEALDMASRIAKDTLDTEIISRAGGDESSLPDYVERVTVYSSKPKGYVLVFAEASVRKGEKVVQKGKALISAGEQHPVSVLCERALNAVAALKPEDEQSREIRSKLLEELRRRQTLLFPIKKEHTTAQLRSILNPLDSALFYGNFGNPEVLKVITDAIVAELRKYGWREVIVPLGTIFDDSFSPSKFERNFIESDKPKGTIVGTIRRGFVDSSGVATQKALLAISK